MGYNNGDMNSAIDSSANSFLSAIDNEVAKMEAAFNRQLEARKKAAEAEYSYRAQLEKQSADLALQIALKQEELKAAKSKQDKLKLQKEIDKLDKKKQQTDFKKELENEKKIEKEVDKYKRKLANDSRLKEHTDRIDAIEEEIELFGTSVGREFRLTMAKESERIARQGGLLKAILGDLAGAAKQAAGAAQKALTQGVDDAMQLFVDKASRINARLQGTSKTFNKMNDVFQRNLGVSPFVKYADALEDLTSLVDAGIAYNVEQRAFLNSISDKIATTFDTANATLFKIIRIQQEDSTIYRLGAEAELTKFFNSRFNDSSYMSDVYDSVSQAVADSVAQLGTSGGAEYEYNLQKWLGSLYSLGMSSDTLTNLAGAINMLSTGDIEGLEGSGLQNLLVMAANKGNIAYGDLLSMGMNANNIDVLMSNIVSYWSELATTSNQVVRRQYANLFGMDMSDMVAIRNINQQDINNILKEQFAYSEANAVLQAQMNQISSRMHISEMIQNAFSNVLTGIGTQIAKSPGASATWLINSMIKDATGGINIPHITAFGTGIGLETDLNSLIQLGMVGAGALGQIGNLISSISNKGGLNLSSWSAEQYNSHGQGLSGVVSGVQATTSSTAYVGNSESSDIYSSTLNAAYDNVDTTVAGEAVDEADKMQKAITESLDPNVQAILDILRQVTNGSAIRVKVEDYGLTSSF